MLERAKMNAPPQRLLFTAAFSLAVLSAALLFTQTISAQEAGDQAVEERIPLTSAELEELVGPIALYPDNLVSIVLPASTFPLQIVQAARYLKNHEADPTLKHDQSWDDSVVALLNYPDVIELMNEDLDWTRQLGDAAVYQQTELLDAIQAFRERAYAAGNLKSDDRQVVTKREEIIVIEPTDPKVIYVPDYEPEVVVVRHVYPVYHYYPRAYPVYYYPYPYGHSFVQGLFWGVTLAFTIDWHAHHVHVRHHHHYKHPYYGRYYHYPYYRRHAVRIAYRDHIWRPRHNHHLRHRHTTARIKANRRIEAGRTRHTLHRKHTHHRFEGLRHKSATRAHGPNRITHRRDTAVIRGDHSAKPKRHGERRAGSASGHPQAFAEKRNFKQRAERRRAHSSRPLEHRANRSGGFRSNQHSRDRAGFRAAPRHRIERGATARRGAVERRSAIASGRRGGRSLEGMAKHGRRDFRPRAGGRFKPETRFRGGGRSSFGGGSRRHVR